VDGALLLVAAFCMGDIAATDGEALRKMYSLNFETAYSWPGHCSSICSRTGMAASLFMGARPAIKRSMERERSLIL